MANEYNNKYGVLIATKADDYHNFKI